MENVEIRLYDSSREAEMLSDIAAFWKTHYLTLTPEEAASDLRAWTAEGHELYVILCNGAEAGFLHMGSRGSACDWLEDVFVREELRCRGIGSRAIELAWDMLREKGLETMYLEVVPANEAAIRLYHKLGFTNLNTLTLNRSVKEKRQLGTETIGGLTFRTYRPNNG